MTPFIIVFPDIYHTCNESGQECTQVTQTQKNLYTIEYVLDSIYLLDILLNFLKRTMACKDLKSIALNYLSTTFIPDVLATIPCLLFLREQHAFFWFKLCRIVHFYHLTYPLSFALNCALQKYSKKRQNDLIVFARLILIVIYISHVMACIWLLLGSMEPCTTTKDANCTKSWIYQNEFEKKSIPTKYIFAFYWIFEVITTVGYGDFSGATSSEYVFSIILEFLGLTFFSFLMGSINGIFNTSDNFDDLIEEKLDQLDMWIKKIEKSNRPFHIQPSLYNDIRKYVEQAFLHDFNLVIEEFDFYH